MNHVKRARPSPAILVAVIALVAALGGSAVAEVATTSKLDKKEKKQTKKLAKQQANKQIDKKESGLDVNSAKTATSATTAGSANPIAYARVNAGGGVDESKSKGVSDANVTNDLTGGYCFRGLGFTPKGAAVTADYADFGRHAASFALGDPLGDCTTAGAQAIANVWDDATSSFTNSSFFIIFYN